MSVIQGRSSNGKNSTRPPPVESDRRTVKVFPETKMRLDIIVAAERKTLSALLEEMIDGRYRLALDAGLLEIGVKKEARYHDIFMVGHGDLWPPPGLIASKTLHIPGQAKQKADIIAAAYGLSLADALGRMTCLRYAELLRKGGLPPVGHSV
jgi:hypothetical protein